MIFGLRTVGCCKLDRCSLTSLYRERIAVTENRKVTDTQMISASGLIAVVAYFQKKLTCPRELKTESTLGTDFVIIGRVQRVTVGIK